MTTDHEIRRQQAVTRWREGVRESSWNRSRFGQHGNPTDEEYVAEYLDELVGEVERLRAERFTLSGELKATCAMLRYAVLECESHPSGWSDALADRMRRRASMTRRAIPADDRAAAGGEKGGG